MVWKKWINIWIKDALKGLIVTVNNLTLLQKKSWTFWENGKQQLKMFWWTSLFSLTCLCLSVLLHSILHYNQCCYTIETIPTYRDWECPLLICFLGQSAEKARSAPGPKATRKPMSFNPPHSPDEGSMQLWRRWLEEWWITSLGSSYPWQDCQTVTFMTFSNFTTPCIVYYKDSMII